MEYFLGVIVMHIKLQRKKRAEKKVSKEEKRIEVDYLGVYQSQFGKCKIQTH